MADLTKLNGAFEVRFNILIRYSLLLLIAFKSYSAGRQLLKAMFLNIVWITGRWKTQIEASEFTLSKRRTRGSQNFQGIRVLKYSKAWFFEGQVSRRANVEATTKSMKPILSSSSALNNSRVTIVGSIKIIATYGSSR